MTSVTNNFIVEPVFICSICLFKPKPENPDNDDRLTIIGGDLVCIDHQEYAVPMGNVRSRMMRKDIRFPNL